MTLPTFYRAALLVSLVGLSLAFVLGRRPAGELRRLVWRVPLLYVLVSGSLLLGFAALRGWIGALWPEHAGLLALRTVAHLVLGYGYLALVHLALARLQASGGVQSPVARPS